MPAPACARDPVCHAGNLNPLGPRPQHPVGPFGWHVFSAARIGVLNRKLSIGRRVFEHPKDSSALADADAVADFIGYTFNRSQVPAAKLAAFEARIAPPHQLSGAAGLAIGREQAMSNVTS